MHEFNVGTLESLYVFFFTISANFKQCPKIGQFRNTTEKVEYIENKQISLCMLIQHEIVNFITLFGTCISC